jgi:septal ring factor EnvC (AmiA/AmiB activator)
LEKEIQGLISEIASLDGQIARLDAELRPVTTLEYELKDRIRATHGQLGHLTQFNPAGAEARRPLFDRLMDIAESHGPVKARRSEMKSRMKAYERKVEAMRNELEREKNRAKRTMTKGTIAKPKKQGELF